MLGTTVFCHHFCMVSSIAIKCETFYATTCNFIEATFTTQVRTSRIFMMNTPYAYMYIGGFKVYAWVQTSLSCVYYQF